MADISTQDILDVLKQVKHPGLDRDIVSIGLVKSPEVDGSTVTFGLDFSTQDEPTRQAIARSARDAVHELPGVEDVRVMGPPPPGSQDTAPGGMSPPGPPPGAAPSPQQNAQGKITLPGVKNIIAVASGKGGVGKSTTSVNLSVALAEAGCTVGLLDADIYGPSIPTMMGSKDQPGVVGNQLLPLISHDIKMMTFGFLIDEDYSVTWRSPKVHQAVHVLLRDVLWG